MKRDTKNNEGMSTVGGHIKKIEKLKLQKKQVQKAVMLKILVAAEGPP